MIEQWILAVLFCATFLGCVYLYERYSHCAAKNALQLKIIGFHENLLLREKQSSAYWEKKYNQAIEILKKAEHALLEQRTLLEDSMDLAEEVVDRYAEDKLPHLFNKRNGKK